MCFWLNVIRELYYKLYLIVKFVGVDVVEIEIWKDWIEVGFGKLGENYIVV